MESYQKSAIVEDPSPQEMYVGCPYPLGSTTSPEGTNFSVFSANATGVEIVFFDHADDAQGARVISLDPVLHRTSHYWHISVPDIRHWLAPSTPGHKRQVNGHHIDDECGGQEHHTYPESPIPVRASPVGAEVPVGRILGRPAFVVMPFLHIVHCFLNPASMT